SFPPKRNGVARWRHTSEIPPTLSQGGEYAEIAFTIASRFLDVTRCAGTVQKSRTAYFFAIEMTPIISMTKATATLTNCGPNIQKSFFFAISMESAAWR